MLALVLFDVLEVAVDADAAGNLFIESLPFQGPAEFLFDGGFVGEEVVEDFLIPFLVAGVDVDFGAAVVEIDDYVTVHAVGAFDGFSNPVVGCWHVVGI